ncbi:MAG: phosphopentomutase [Eubacteriales bacterium]|nr:phosphopentomutase [Eubacteriales bacterium]
MKIRKAALIVVDGLGVGALPDAAKYGDEGANSLQHVLEACAPELENLREMGLINAAGLPDAVEEPLACYGKMAELSAGKDTTTGHWELAGLPVPKPFPTYPDGFPQDLIERFENETGHQVIGNKPASGTEILEELGPEHLRTGKLIVYTSADSVFQIAAHEAVLPPAELWHICRIARRILQGEHAVARVIARPFVGNPGAFVRTGNRRDFSVEPFGPTLLDVLHESGVNTVGIGKIEDIFNRRGLSSSVHSAGNAACLDALCETLKNPRFSGLAFVNLVDTDSAYGHRRDAQGYADCLQQLDDRLPEIMRLIGDDGLLLLVADHGCDPCFPGSDHTREYVPLLIWGLGIQEGVDLGVRGSFADVSATLLDAFGVKKKLAGESFWADIAL